MNASKVSGILLEKQILPSTNLDRDVQVDFYLPKNVDPSNLHLLLINDGQDLLKFNFESMLDELHSSGRIEPLLCVAMHCGKDRKSEYGTALIKDYRGRGDKAMKHRDFVLQELIPFTRKTYGVEKFKSISFAGFSLGGLSAIDIAWNHPNEFSRIGVFSGSLWWRLRGLKEGYVEDTDRIMHKQIREGGYYPWLKFFFTTGSLDEKMDRNNNGVIDSIDDTMGLISELEKKGYTVGEDVVYINYKDGKHDVETWGRAMPGFLIWGWGVSK